MEVKALIIYGDGINAEKELQNAFILNGAKADLIHINEILENPKIIHQYQILGFPGGFSFGDEIRSGKVFAIKLKNKIQGELTQFLKDKKLMIGICNGFQTLVQLNIFSEDPNHRSYTLTTNDHGQFKNFWTEVKIEASSSPWLKNINQKFFLPVRHKEGQLFGSFDEKNSVIRYTKAINGSIYNTAGIINPSGQVLGLMPHPEAALNEHVTPEGINKDNHKTVNLIFKNAINYIQSEVLS